MGLTHQDEWDYADSLKDAAAKVRAVRNAVGEAALGALHGVLTEAADEIEDVENGLRESACDDPEQWTPPEPARHGTGEY